MPTQQTIRATPVRLDSNPGSAPKWVQIAKSGTFKGYNGGATEFTFDRELFRQIIANFRADPAYDGKSPVVPWDVGHASEVAPAERTLEGSAATGWVVELDVRSGPEGAELWAKTLWREDAAEAIKAGSYRWASVAVVFDAVDPLTGRNIGPVLTSVAMTNSPFLQGMQPLAASAGYHRHQGRLMHDTIINDYDGRNDVEKYLNFVRTTKPDLPQHRQVLEAHELYRKNRPRVRLGELLPEKQPAPPPSPSGEIDIREPARNETNINPPTRRSREELLARARQIAPNLGNATINQRAVEAIADLLWVTEQHALQGGTRENAIADISNDGGAGETILRDLSPSQRSRLLEQLGNYFDERAAEVRQSSMAADLSRYPGANRIEQAVNMLRDREPGFARLSWDQQVVRAGKVARAAR